MSTPSNDDNKLDFGAGLAVALPSRCLLVAKEPTDCDICIQMCPASALSAKEAEDSSEEESGSQQKRALDKKLGVKISDDCIRCGLCSSVCPLEALSNTKHHPKGLEKNLKASADKLEGISLSCARSLYGVPTRLSSRALSVPCLASLTSEAWFLAAALARDALYEPESEEGSDTKTVSNLKVFLPPLICSDCPVNTCGDAEEVYTNAISEAESWGAINIELIDEPEELAFSYSGKLMSSLGEISSDGKRELVQHLASGFSRSWQSAKDDLSREKSKAELLAKRRKKIKTSPPLNLNTPRPFGKKSTRRLMLRTALTQDDSLAEGVELLVASTEVHLCTGCGACVSACPLNARRRISSNSVIYFGKLPEEKRPKEKQAAVTDQLCCLGCSACVQVCPTGACTLSWLNGQDFYDLRQS